MKRKPALILFAFLLGLLSNVFGKQPEPPFAEELPTKTGQTPFDLIGEYRYVYRMFFKLYDVALYAPKAISAHKVTSAETDFDLRFRYLRKIDKDIILESSAKMLERNLTSIELQAIKERVTRLNEAYTTVRDGDRSALSYREGFGTTLYINSKAIITIPGKDFAALYFKIWLGERGLSEKLRQSLLGLI